MSFSGLTVLPTDLDIFRPFAVHDEPGGEHLAIRGVPATGHAHQQARLEPAAVLIASPPGTGPPGRPMSGRRSLTAAKAQAESNHTSRMSVSLRSVVPPHDWHFRPGGAKRVQGRRVPDARALLLHRVSHPLHQLRAHHRLAAPLAEEHRDGHAPRPLAADAPVRSVLHHPADARRGPSPGPRPPSGRSPLSALLRSVASSPAVVSRGRSMAMNHWGVARKMIGLWQRQQCG